jgi:hypothetical protein
LSLSLFAVDEEASEATLAANRLVGVGGSLDVAAPDGMRKALTAGNAKSIDNKHVRAAILLPSGFLALSGEHEEEREQKLHCINSKKAAQARGKGARGFCPVVPAGTFGATPDRPQEETEQEQACS